MQYVVLGKLEGVPGLSWCRVMKKGNVLIHTLFLIPGVAFSLFLREEVIQNGALAHIIIIRHAPPTARSNLINLYHSPLALPPSPVSLNSTHIHDNNTPTPRLQLHLLLRNKRIEFFCPIFQHFPFSPQPHNFRRANERDEHYADARVTGLVQVGKGFDAAAGEVHVPECSGGEDAEVAAAFRGDVDVARAGEGGCSAVGC